MITVKKISADRDLKVAFDIRTTVFVDEQHVPPEEELDQYEQESHHFLAYSGDSYPCGTARWRKTSKGIKLERFAVLKDFRSRGVGSALLRAVLDDIAAQVNTGSELYLHAQITAVGLYKKFGFQTVGNQFFECDIPHFKMIYSQKMMV